MEIPLSIRLLSDQAAEPPPSVSKMHTLGLYPLHRQEVTMLCLERSCCSDTVAPRSSKLPLRPSSPLLPSPSYLDSLENFIFSPPPPPIGC